MGKGPQTRPENIDVPIRPELPSSPPVDQPIRELYDVISDDGEFQVISVFFEACKRHSLDLAARRRVLEYLSARN